MLKDNSKRKLVIKVYERLHHLQSIQALPFQLLKHKPVLNPEMAGLQLQTGTSSTSCLVSMNFSLIKIYSMDHLWVILKSNLPTFREHKNEIKSLASSKKEAS